MSYDPQVVATIIDEGRRRGLGMREIVSALSTGLVESGLRNVTHGDRDSLGVFQQRPSQGWGTPEQVQDVAHATGRYYDAIPQFDQPGISGAELAARIQRPAAQYRGRYADRWDEALRIFQDYDGDVSPMSPGERGVHDAGATLAEVLGTLSDRIAGRPSGSRLAAGGLGAQQAGNPPEDGPLPGLAGRSVMEAADAIFAAQRDADGGEAPTDTAGIAPDADGFGAQVLTIGEQYLGTPYLWGGTSPDTGFDCSGLVQHVYRQLGIELPRVSADQAQAGRPVASIDEARPGDLVFWRGADGRPNHIGIYAGNGMFLEAPRTGLNVRYRQLGRTPDAIRRVTPDG